MPTSPCRQSRRWFIDKVLAVVPVVMQRQVLLPSLNQVTKHVEFPQTQYTGKVVAVPVVIQRQVPQTHGVLKTVQVSTAQFRQSCESTCDHADASVLSPRERISLEAERDRLRNLIGYMSGHGFGFVMHHGTDA